MIRLKSFLFAALSFCSLRLIGEGSEYGSLLIESTSDLYEMQEERYIQRGFLPALLERPLSFSSFPGIPEIRHAIALPAADSFFIPRVRGTIQFGTSTLLNRYTMRTMNEFVYAEDGILDLDGDGTAETPQTSDNYGTDWGFTGNTKQISPYEAVYGAFDMQSAIRLDMAVITGPFGISYSQDFRPAYSYFTEDQDYTNIPLDIGAIDVNFPYRTYINYYSNWFEAAFGRDRLQNGPGRHSLTLNEKIPYYDHVRLRFKTGAISHTTYFIRLNPALSSGEMQYINYLYDNWNDDSFIEPNASWNPRIFDQSKHYVISKLGIHPFSRLHIAVTQMHLIGGRVPQLPDFNPLMVYHNLYEEGQYSVPISFSAAMIPVNGLRVYGEVLIYDLEFGNEVGNAASTNPNALAYQAGCTGVTRPLKRFGNGYLRIDAEWNYVMPWVYAEESSYRNMSSRFIFTDPYRGRKWVDFPLGFYLGPDSFESYLSVLYKTGKWDLGLSWTFTGKGSVYLEGYGSESPIANRELYEQKGLLTQKPGERITYDHEIILKGKTALQTLSGTLSCEAKTGLRIIQNLNHEPGSDFLTPVAGITVSYSY